MTNPYHKILKKITDTEKRLKPNKHDISAILDYELNEAHSLTNQDYEIVDEYKTLKDNIASAMSNNFNLAYQPVKIKTRKWSHTDL